MQNVKLSPLEYEWLTGWEGPAGAAYNQIYEFLCKDGLINRAGEPTKNGIKAVEEYEAYVLRTHNEPLGM